MRDNSLEQIKKQAKDEGGRILILPSDHSEEAGGLSSRISGNASSEAFKEGGQILTLASAVANTLESSSSEGKDTNSAQEASELMPQQAFDDLLQKAHNLSEHLKTSKQKLSVVYRTTPQKSSSATPAESVQRAEELISANIEDITKTIASLLGLEPRAAQSGLVTITHPREHLIKASTRIPISDKIDLSIQAEYYIIDGKQTRINYLATILVDRETGQSIASGNTVKLPLSYELYDESTEHQLDIAQRTPSYQEAIRAVYGALDHLTRSRNYRDYVAEPAAKPTKETQPKQADKTTRLTPPSAPSDLDPLEQIKYRARLLAQTSESVMPTMELFDPETAHTLTPEEVTHQINTSFKQSLLSLAQTIIAQLGLDPALSSQGAKKADGTRTHREIVSIARPSETSIEVAIRISLSDSVDIVMNAFYSSGVYAYFPVINKLSFYLKDKDTGELLSSVFKTFAPEGERDYYHTYGDLYTDRHPLTYSGAFSAIRAAIANNADPWVDIFARGKKPSKDPQQALNLLLSPYSPRKFTNPHLSPNTSIYLASLIEQTEDPESIYQILLKHHIVIPEDGLIYHKTYVPLVQALARNTHISTELALSLAKLKEAGVRRILALSGKLPLDKLAEFSRDRRFDSREAAKHMLKKQGQQTGKPKLSKYERDIRKEIIELIQRAGIEVITDTEEALKLLDEAGLRYFHTSSGEVYGFTDGKRIYLDPNLATAETAIHEYTHLWADALRAANPTEWQNIVSLLQDTPFWQETASLYPELADDTNALADEVLAHFSGKYNYERLERETIEALKRKSSYAGRVTGNIQDEVLQAMSKIIDALGRFWKWTADALGQRFTSPEDIADQVMVDIFRRRNILGEAEEARLEATNNQFNKQLAKLKEKNADQTTLSLGMPSSILLSAGVVNNPMRLYANKLIKEMKKHGLPSSALKNLPYAVADPIAVFNPHGDGSHTILTRLRTKAGDALVSIQVGKAGDDLDFNILSSTSEKDFEQIISWFNQGYATYINQRKALEYLASAPAPIAGAKQQTQELDSATKAIKDFENPTLHPQQDDPAPRLSREYSWGQPGYTEREDGTPISQRAYDAEQNGRFTAPLFRKVYGLTKRLFGMLQAVNAVDSAEWHHVGKYFTREPFFRWTDEYEEDYREKFGTRFDEQGRTTYDTEELPFSVLIGAPAVYQYNEKGEATPADPADYHYGVKPLPSGRPPLIDSFRSHKKEIKALEKAFKEAQWSFEPFVHNKFGFKDDPEKQSTIDNYISDIYFWDILKDRWLNQTLQQGIMRQLISQQQLYEKVSELQTLRDERREQGATPDELSSISSQLEKTRMLIFDLKEGLFEQIPSEYQELVNKRTEELRKEYSQLAIEQIQKRNSEIDRQEREAAQQNAEIAARNLKRLEPEANTREAILLQLARILDLNTDYLISKLQDGRVDHNIAEGGKLKLRFQKASPSLVGLHNISEDKLRSALRLGGLANPSAAVIDADNQSHTGFGEISLILPSTLIDKRTGRNAGTFFGDAWTPTFPRIYYKLSAKDDKRLNDILYPIGRETGMGVVYAVNRYITHGDTAAIDDLRFAFLAMTGRDFQPVYKNRPNISPEVAKLYNELIHNKKRLPVTAFIKEGGDELDKIKTLYAMVNLNGGLDEYNQHIAQKIEEFENESSFTNPEDRRIMAELKAEGYQQITLSAFLDKMYRAIYQKSLNVDTYATWNAAKKYIDEHNLQDQFQSWLSHLREEFNATPYIEDQNGRRSKLTLESVSKAMNRGDKQAVGIAPTISGLAVHSMQKTGSLAQMRKAKHRLQSQESKQDFLAQREELFFSLASKLGQGEEQYYRLIELSEAPNPKAYAKVNWNIDLSDEDIQSLSSLVSDLQNNLPAPYFETKFNRPVFFDELAGAVIPNNLPDDLKEQLRSFGIPLYEYDPENEESRQEAFIEASQAEGVRFRLADTPSLDAVNSQFNQELQQQIDGELPQGHVYYLGMPSPVLRSTGIPNLPIELTATRAEEKSKQENHKFDLDLLKNLPKLLQNPVAIFAYGDKNKAQNIIVEVEYNGKNLLVGLSLNQEMG